MRKYLIAVKTDNSNDTNYPPGTPQYSLDFAYHGWGAVIFCETEIFGGL